LNLNPTHNPSTRTERTRDWLQQGVLPVVVIPSVKQGLEIAEGLCAGGITQIEITLRTPEALQAMGEIAKRFPDLRVSAGTVLTPTQFDQTADLGATLFISPGLTEVLAEHALKKGYAWVPGAATASEMMRALELGFELLKFFPAMAAGGPKALAGITAPLAAARIVPTGGVTLENLPQWREIKAVQAVGGTWLTTGLDQVSDIAKVVEQRAALALAAWNGLIQA
jgi:2-dehydro-3-deoxyphosphogluconate aldolase / (4S)-4-hydroxy-2-oxoglutarate aldolase